MPSTNLGKVSVTPKGAWSGSTAYEILDIVSNGGSSYLAITSVPSGTALSNTSYWLMLASKGDKGNTGEINGASASISGGYGTPSVNVTSGGTSTDRSFAFSFANLKGASMTDFAIEETATVGNVHTYTWTATIEGGLVETGTFEVTDGAVTSVNGKTGAVTGVAMDDGYYENMTVGSADQLISSVNIEDKVPYVFRTSGGANDIGDREVDEIVGGTVAWNQLAPAVVGSTYIVNVSATDASGAITITGTASANNRNAYLSAPAIVGHKYLVILNNKTIGSTNTGAIYVLGNYTSLTEITNKGYLMYANASYDYIRLATGTITGLVYDQKFIPQIFDLTQMFGSTIADYIYSLEQSNTGNGVAWFKSLFPKPYYAYNAGQLISVSGLSAHKMTGFNQFNKNDVLNGYITPTDGVFHANSSYVSSNYIRVVPNATYYFKTELADSRNGAWYDSNKAYISQCSYSNGTVVTAPSNAEYIIFGVTSPTSGNVDTCCFNLAWDGERNGEYEPYESHSYALDSDVTLRGIPKLDADNKLYYDGDVYASDGTVQRRYAVVDMGTINWGYDSSVPRFYTTTYADIVARPVDQYTKANCICGKYPNATMHDVYIDTTDKIIAIANTGSINIKDSAYTDASAFKTAMSGVYLVYELATPTTESAEPYTSPQWVSDWGTEEYVIAEQSGVAMPVGHETKYTANLKAKLEMAPNSPSGNGDYIVRQTNGINEYVPLTERIPNAPSENGNYILKCTVSGSTVTYVWEVQS